MATLDDRLDQLEQRFEEFASDLQLVRLLLDRDPHSTLNKVRYITEGVLLRLCRERGVTWGKAEPTLENMLGPLLAAGAIPKNVGIHLRTIQANASPGSHFQETPLNAGHVHIALLALVDVLEWVVSRATGAVLDRAEVLARPVWKPCIVHPLQPARHFAGRTELLARLRDWWSGREAADRVVSLVAIGGTGKTALVEQLLRQAGPGGSFVWSFYEDQRTETLLAKALEYFGVRDVEVGARFERLRAYLAGAKESHTFVFDGLEAIQGSGGSGKLRGKIDDAAVRLLLRSIAAGLGNTRALVTSRSKLVDLEDWRGCGYSSTSLDDLDREASRAVLRAWGVTGADAALDALHDRVGGHALSIAVMGSYIAGFCDGDPHGLGDVPLEVAAEDDPLAARLSNVLDRYAEALPVDERDLLVRLSAFPHGTDAALLGFLSRDAEVAGSLSGLAMPALQALLDRLVRRGLVYAARSPSTVRYSAHPFLRQHLKRLLHGVSPARLHEAVRTGLAPTLEGAPRTVIREPALLDRYEQLIEHTRLAGHVSTALVLFERALGGYHNLGPTLGENARGLRIASGLLEDERTGRTHQDGPEDRAGLFAQTAMFARAVGDVGEARRLFESGVPFCDAPRSSNWLFVIHEALIDIERLAGNFERAIDLVRLELDHRPTSARLNAMASHVFRLVGLDEEAARCLTKSASSTSIEPLLVFHRGMAMLHAGGDLAVAAELLERAASDATTHEAHLYAARCRFALGMVQLATGQGSPELQLDAVRTWALRSGSLEMLVHAEQLASGIAIARGDHATAARHARDGMRLAESAGFETLAIDLLLGLARVDRALTDEVRRRAERCGYSYALDQVARLVE